VTEIVDPVTTFLDGERRLLQAQVERINVDQATFERSFLP
jgi:hypothetical protein